MMFDMLSQRQVPWWQSSTCKSWKWQDEAGTIMASLMLSPSVDMKQLFISVVPGQRSSLTSAGLRGCQCFTCWDYGECRELFCTVRNSLTNFEGPSESARSSANQSKKRHLAANGSRRGTLKILLFCFTRYAWPTFCLQNQAHNFREEIFVTDG